MKNKKSIRRAKRIKGECHKHKVYDCLFNCKYYETCAIRLLPRIMDFDTPAKTDIRDLREGLKGQEIK